MTPPRPYNVVRDARPDQVARLVDHLRQDGPVTPNVDLQPAMFVDGWSYSRGPSRGGRRPDTHYLWMPGTPPHDSSIPWAARPSDWCGSHAEAVEVLRARWIGDAERWLSAQREVTS